MNYKIKPRPKEESKHDQKRKKRLCILLAGLLTLSTGNLPVDAQETATAATKAQQAKQAELPNPENPDINTVGAANEETDPANFKKSL